MRLPPETVSSVAQVRAPRSLAAEPLLRSEEDPRGRSAPWSDAVKLRTTFGIDLLAERGDYFTRRVVLDGLFEPAESDLFSRLVRPGDVCVDVGCHIGWYSCLLATLVESRGRVLSIDANPRCCERTRFNLQLNGLGNVQIVHAAVADREGSGIFHVSSEDQSGLSSLGEIPTSASTLSVPVVRLERLMRERSITSVRLLKMDVEGAEEQVLRGLGSYLADGAIDFLSLECYDLRLAQLQSSTEKVGALLEAAGYRCWEYGASARAGWAPAARIASRGDCNLLFVSPRATPPPLAFTLNLALRSLEDRRHLLEAEVVRLAGVADAHRVLERQLDSIHRSKTWKVLKRINRIREALTS